MSKRRDTVSYRRSLGVARAWKREKGHVCQGWGTREWIIREQKALLDNGRVKGYQGHHMKPVAKYPQYADDPNNIQFLRCIPEDNEHLRAHAGDFRNDVEGMYDVRTGWIVPLPPGRVHPIEPHELREKAVRMRGYTRYAESAASKRTAPRRKKAQTQVQFEGRSYTRTMIRTGVPAAPVSPAPAQATTAARTKSAAAQGRTASSGSTASLPKASPAARKSTAASSTSAAPKTSPARKSTAANSASAAPQRRTSEPGTGTRRSSFDPGVPFGSVRQMARAFREEAERRRKR